MRLIELPRDSRGFVRRRCPRCARAFKTRPNEGDAVAVQARLAESMQHENPHEWGHPMALTCPYCGETASSESFLTGPQRHWLDELGKGTARELRYWQLSHVEQTLKVNPRPTFAPLRPVPGPTALPPEPDDLKEVPLLCCADEALVEPRWSGRLYCPLCGTRQETGPVPIDVG